MAVAVAALVAGARAAPSPAPARSDSAAVEGLVISRIEIVPGPVFEPGPNARLRSVQEFGNKVHARTRAGTIRRQLLFHVGERWSEAAGRESGRNLRALDYLEPRRIAARRLNDSAAVRVETRDLWRTSPRFNIASADGRRVGSIGLTDKNLLGYGKSVAVMYRDDENGKAWSTGYTDPNLGGGPLRLRYGAGRGSQGANDQIELGLPFLGLQTPLAWNGGWNRGTGVVHLFAAGSELANFDERVERSELWVGRRLADGDAIQRVLGSFELYDRRFGPSRLSPGAPTSFAGGEENIRIRRLAAELSVWQPNFIERQDVNRVGRTEDFDVGLQAALKAGFAPRLFGSTRDEGFLAARFDLGSATALGFGWVHSLFSTRLVPEVVERIGQIEGHWIAGPWRGHSLAFGALGMAGLDAPRDYQARVGGLDGLRAYPADAVAGRRLWRLNAEERWLFSPPSWRLVRFGSATFFDAAHAWDAGAEGTGWYQDAGIGLRLGAPMWGLSEVLRIDVAWPVTPARDGGHKPVLTFGSSQAF
jgi:hypothetical protein